MSDCLIVIGNGFDLFHGIPSSYWGFYNYLKENSSSYNFLENLKRYDPESEESIFSIFGNTNNSDDDTSSFLEKIERFIDTDELWCNFEKALGDLDADELRDYFSDEIKSYGDDDWSDSYHHSYQFAIEEGLGFAKQIPKYLKDWICKIDIDTIKPKLSANIISPDAFYITFNYTRTLEDVYDIPDKQICHIHGSVDDFGELIVGHGDKSSFKRPPLYTYEEDDDIRLIEGEKLIAKYFKKTYKNVEKIIKQNEGVWNRLKKVKKVYILGHSLSDVDMPYFEKIYQSVHPKCKWFVSYYEPEYQYYFENILKNIGISKDNISLIKLEDLR